MEDWLLEGVWFKLFKFLMHKILKKTFFCLRMSKDYWLFKFLSRWNNNSYCFTHPSINYEKIFSCFRDLTLLNENWRQVIKKGTNPQDFFFSCVFKGLFFFFCFFNIIFKHLAEKSSCNDGQSWNPCVCLSFGFEMNLRY